MSPDANALNCDEQDAQDMAIGRWAILPCDLMARHGKIVSLSPFLAERTRSGRPRPGNVRQVYQPREFDPHHKFSTWLYASPAIVRSRYRWHWHPPGIAQR
jgi:hypothetical protein